MATHPRKRNARHDPSDELLEARAKLALLREARSSLPHRVAVAVADGDIEAYAALQLEASILPARIRAAEEAVLEAESNWHRDEACVDRELKCRQATGGLEKSHVYSRSH